MEKGLFRQPKEASRSVTSGLIGDFNGSDTHWKGSIAGCLLSSWCLGSLVGTSLHRCQANKGDAHLNLVLAKEAVLIRDVKTSVSLGCSEIVGEDFAGHLAVVPWAATLKGSRAQYSWSFRKACSKHKTWPDQ